MQSMPTDPITEDDILFIDDMLMKYGSEDDDDEPMLNFSEIDGFLTALVSGPEAVMPSQWLPEIWGGPEIMPKWKSEEEAQRFMTLLIQHMNCISTILTEVPEHYEPMFYIRDLDDEDREVMIVDEWCLGYMRGIWVSSAKWDGLPEDMEHHLAVIALHGSEENFDLLENYTLDDHDRDVKMIEEGARALHAYWLAQRQQS